MASPLNEDLPFSPDDYEDNPEQEDDEGGPNHKKRKQVKRACFSCRKAHARCDEERPCRRCIRTGCEATCVDVPRKKRVLKKPAKEEKPMKRGRRRKVDEHGEGCESGGENDSKFYFDAAEDEVIDGGSVAAKSAPTLSSSTSVLSSKSLPPAKKFDFSVNAAEDMKLSWKDSLLDSMAFAHNEDEKEASANPHEEEGEFSFDLGKSSDDERCLEEIPQEMVRELTELRSYNSSLQDMIKDVQQFNSYQRKKRRQWELSKINNGGSSTTASSLTAATPNDTLPQWLVSDFSSLSTKLVDLSSDPSPSSSGAASSAHPRDDHSHDIDYLAAWQQSTMVNQGTPLQLPPQLAQLAGLQQPLSQQRISATSAAASSSAPNSASSGGAAPFTTSLPFTEV